MFKTSKKGLLSLIMALVLLIGCVPAFSVAVSAQTEAVYYLKGGATGNGTSADTPAGTLSALVAQIEADGLNVAGKEITVKVMDSSSSVAYNSESGSYKIVPYNATLIFESHGDNKTTLWITNHNASRGDGQHLRVSGPTVFRNINLRAERTYSDWVQIYGNGYDTTFENVRILAKGGENLTTYNTVFSQGARINGGIGGGQGNGGTFTIDTATMKMNNLGYLDLAGYLSSGSEVYENDVKVVAGSGTNVPSGIRLSANSKVTTTYKKNANIVLNGTQVTSLEADGPVGNMTEGHALQIIYNSGAAMLSESPTYSISHLPRYDIYVENIEGGALDTTDTAGTYSVTLPSGMKYAVATDADGNKYCSNNGILTVGEPGKYNVSFTETFDIVYYLKGGATGNGTSADTPAGTLSALVAQIEADGNNVSGKTVTVKVISNGSSYVYYSSENSAKATVPYSATLIFESYDAETPSILGVTSGVSVRGDQHLRITGPTVFKNIGIQFDRGYTDWMETYCGGYDVTFENVQFYGQSTKVPSTANGNRAIVAGSIDGLVDGEGGTVIVDTATITKNTMGLVSASGGVSKSYPDQLTLENDVKVVLGSSDLYTALRVGGAAEGATVAYKKNLNIVLNGTTVPMLYSRNYISAMTDGHALQIIYNNGATITSETTGTYAFKNLARYDIYVENIEGGALDTTDTAGTYSVSFPEGKNIVYYYAVNSNGDYDGTTPVTYANTSEITVGGTGKYKVGFVSDPSEINVDIVNEYAQYDGWINNTEDGFNGTLTPAVAASNVVETDISGIDGAVVYTCNINFEAGSKNTISAVGNIAESDIIKLSDEGFTIGGYIVSGEFGYGEYGVKITLAPASCALIVEITKPDGTVIRRGDNGMLAGNTSFTKVVAKSSLENGITDNAAVESDFVPESYTLNTTEPVYTGFEENVYNLVTSYDVDAKTTRAFAWTAKASYVSADEDMAVRYNVKGASAVNYVDAVRKTEKTVYDDIDFFEADITGLTPGTTYEYSIGKKNSSSADDWSSTYTFTTESENVTDFSFITISDTQGESWDGRGFMYAQTVLDEAFEDVKDPAFILNAGDLVEKGGRESMWVQYFKAMGDTVKSVPHFAVMGNHEYQESGGPDTDFLFNLHLNHPNNGGEKAIAKWANLGNSVMNAINNPKELAYSYDYGNAHFVVLNSGPSGGTDAYLLGAQKSWLISDLEASNAKWKIVVVHQPAHTATGDNEYFTKYDIDKTMESLGVDLVIQGHAHYNTRTYPMKDRVAVRKDNPDVITKGEGTVYSIVGSTTTNHDVLKDNLNENYVTVFSPKSEMPVYAVVDVTDRALTYTVKQADGMTVDKFTIVNEEAYVPETLGAQIRLPSGNGTVTQGLRFVSSISKGLYEEFAQNGTLPASSDDKGVGFGSVIIPENLLGNAQLTKETEDAKTVPAVNIYKDDGANVSFTVCLTSVPENRYESNYCVVPYVTVMKGDEEVTYYGEMITTSIYEIACLACGEGSKESETAKSYLKTNIIDVVEINK